jgi:CheY-like chemotaxis protein/glycine cleavage system H lipoate-binding protein
MGKRILVVDDEVVVLGAVGKALRKTDYHIDTAQSAEEALKLLSDTSYDVVITDLMMAGIDGIGLMQRMRDMGTEAETIVITGFPTIESALRAKQLGVFEYVTKPFTRQELLSVVIRALRRGEAGALTPSPDSSDASEQVYFIPDHAWAKREPDRTVRIGMARAFASTVGEVCDLELPAEDEFLQQGRMCVVVRAEDGVEHYLHSPLSGRVLETNPMLVEDAELAVRDPEGNGWLLRMDPQDPDSEIENLTKTTIL